jgi:hypothetical protein
MKRLSSAQIAVDAFFDNFSMAALFGKLRIPGAPRLAIDPRSLAEYLSAMDEKEPHSCNTRKPSSPTEPVLHSVENLQQTR